MNVEFFKPFVDGTLETLKVQCSTEARPGKPFFQPAVTSPDPGIAAVIGLTGEGVRASVTLCFPERLFLKVMSNMLGEDCHEMTRELEDGVAELLNIIFGSAKRQINAAGYGNVQMAIPTILKGKGIEARPLTPEGKVVVLPFITPSDDEFQIQISFEKGGAHDRL
ncbi:MAG: chemotaxis protein CheX [Oligoflexia bacterium]|jgi:CheY-specific phosphatase CheX